ncbi:hypothetical protein C0993_010713 [Termitomyces sp. T159_Od127]|nr:hypothetical protein C0993_010713 [Termitomyces sp. T159_Od127]
MSSLAAQLAQNASLNSALLVDRSRRKSAESYLFTGREADQHDLESIHAIGVNGLLQLALLNPSLRKYEDQLFSEYAKATDRTLLPLEASAELDEGIAAFLALLGPYVMEAPTGKVLEWLVRRLRIHEFNVEAVLSLFLPYHESPHFAKMLSILHIKQNSTWSFLLPFKSAAQNLPRMSLVTEMLRNTDVSRFVTSLLPSALKEKRSHRVLLAFNAACLHDFISRSKALDEGTVAYLLPALLEPLQSTPPIKDAILGSYVLLAALSHKCRIAPAALSAILDAMTTCAQNILAQQYINAILSQSFASEATIARQLLAVIQQRHPIIFQESMDAIIQEEGVEQETVDQLRISLTVVEKMDKGSNHGNNIDMILASTNADAKVRAAAVTDLLGRLSRSGLSTDDITSVHSALLARVQDTNQNVIDALYSQPSAILPILCGDAETYINYLSLILTAPGSKPKRSFLRTHLTFLATHFVPADTSRIGDVFHRVVFPFLLFSKPRQHSAEVVWDILAAQSTLGDHDWLAGCTSIVVEERAKDAADAVEKMSTINAAFCSRIARNILKSNQYQTHLEALIVKLKDSNPHTRVLGYLVARALLMELSGEHQVDAGHRVLAIIDVTELHGMEDFPQDSEDSDKEGAFNKVVVTKPSSKSTLQRLQLSIVALLPSIQRPSGIVLNWLSGKLDPSQANSTKRGSRYVELIRKVYKLANVSNSVPVFTASVLRSLFLNLKGDALAFLAGICTSSSDTDESLVNLRTVALHHAAAFLQAHLQEDDGLDFQTILPSLLVSLQSFDADERKATLACVSILCQLAERKFTKVYGFDTIYGKNENQLQYLDRDDIKTYLGALVERKDHLVHDAEYINVFHQEHLGRMKTDKKKISEYKHRVLCFIVSHVNALALPTFQIALLKSIEAVSDSAKAEILFPTIKSLLASKKSDATLRDLTDRVMSCFDSSVAEDLNEEKSALWDLYLSVIRFHFEPNAPLSSRTIISRFLEHGLFSALSGERKISLCNLLLELGTQHADAYAACKQLLAHLIEDVPLIIHILGSLQPTSNANAQPATKRAKTT